LGKKERGRIQGLPKVLKYRLNLLKFEPYPLIAELMLLQQ